MSKHYLEGENNHGQMGLVPPPCPLIQYDERSEGIPAISGSGFKEKGEERRFQDLNGGAIRGKSREELIPPGPVSYLRIQKSLNLFVAPTSGKGKK